jgi:hypothetical protein
LNARPTLLIIAYHFAPSPLVGAKRFSFLTREFTRQGFDVHVITQEIRDSAHGREDTSLPLHGTVHRVANPFEPPLEGRGLWRKFVNALFRRLLAPVGMEYYWARAATRKAMQVAAKLPPGVVIATSPPHAALIAGARIARRLGWPLILDYRDPWSAYDWPQWHRGGLTQRLAGLIEGQIVRRSAARVLNTDSMRQWFEQSFALAPARNFSIPNGFDPVAAQDGAAQPAVVRIVHAGEIYGSRSLVPLLRAIDSTSRRHPEKPILLTTYGALPAAEWQRIREAGLEHFVEEKARIPFADLFAELRRAQLLLAVVSEHMTYSTPYKVYDYMAAGRPILALAPQGAALHELLAESGTGDGADPQDIPGIERALERLLFTPVARDEARIARFHWVNLAQQYRAVIEGVSAPTIQDEAARRPHPVDA